MQSGDSDANSLAAFPAGIDMGCKRGVDIVFAQPE
jgi:hypothetical protein